jgi:trigger factor
MASTAHAHPHGHGHHGHDHEEKKLLPKSEISDAGPCKHKLVIEISAQRVKEEIDHKYVDLNESVALPGFRKGHAPRPVLERKFGKSLLDDLRFELASRSFEEVKEERKLEPVGEPDLDPAKLAVEEGKPFVFELTVEVRPKIELKPYEGLKLKKAAVTVEDKDVDAVFKNFQESKAELIPAEDGTAREGNQVIADFTLVVDGKDVETGENVAIFLTEDIQFYGMELKEFHKSLLGKKVGDRVDVPAKLPADFHLKELAGKDAAIRSAIKSVKVRKLPEVDADFAKKHFDMDSLDELKADVRKRILKEKEEQARRVLGQELVDQILKDNEFPMPEGLVQSGTEEALRRARLDMAMKGMPEEEAAKAVEKERSGSKESMAKALKSHFILEHIARKEKIFVVEDQVEERVTQMAASFGRWPHEMKAYLEEQGLMAQLRRSMREDLVKEYLLSKAVIEEEKK